MPRVSVRRLFVYAIYTVVATSLVMLALHVQQQNPLWLRVLDQPGGYYQANSKETQDDESAINNFVILNDGETDLENVSSISALRRHGLPWYIKNDDGYRPQAGDLVHNIWPGRFSGDRIEEQLMIPVRNIDPAAAAESSSSFMGVAQTPLKKIFLPNGLGSWQVKAGQKVFTDQKCPVDQCTLTSKRDEAASADAIMFKGDCHF